MTGGFEPGGGDLISERQDILDSLVEDEQRYARVNKFALISTEVLLAAMLLTETLVDHWEKLGAPELGLGISSAVSGLIGLGSGIKSLMLSNERVQLSGTQREEAEDVLRRSETRVEQAKARQKEAEETAKVQLKEAEIEREQAKARLRSAKQEWLRALIEDIDDEG